MLNFVRILTSAVLLQTYVCAHISFEWNQEDTSLSANTIELLSSFQNCVVYMFGWGLANDYSLHDSTKYFLFYSKNINCALIVESMITGKGEGEAGLNPRFATLEPHSLFTKYTGFLINLYPSATTSYTLKTLSDLDGFHMALLWYNVSFNYVLIFMSTEEFWSIGNVRMATSCVEISSPAVYMLILDENDVNVISFALALQSAPYLFRISRFEVDYIRQLHHDIHKDLHGAVAVLWVADLWEHWKFGAPVRIHPHFSNIDTMAENFNFTYSNQTDGLAVTTILVQMTTDSRLFQSALARTGRTNFDAVSFAIRYAKFNFICIAEVSTIGLEAFVQAYDLLTWTVTAIACLFLSATIAVMIGKTPTSLWSKLQSAAPVVLMLLIERFYGYGQVIRSASRQIVLVVTLWAFGAMLLGMCYSGNMVSLLTSPSLPNCPVGMKALAAIKEYPVLSDHLIQVDEVMRPFFHNGIDEYLTNHAHKNGSLESNLRQFRATVTNVDSINGHQLSPSRNNTSSKILFAYASSTEKVSAYGMWSVMENSKIRALHGGNLPFFNVRAPMAVQTNFLGPILNRFLANYLQRGIGTYMVDGFHAEKVHDIFIRLILTTKKRKWWKMWIRKNKLASIWRNFDPLMDGETRLSALTMGDLNAPFTLLGICLLLAACAFMRERYSVRVIIHVLFRMAKKVPMVIHRAVLKHALILQHMAARNART